MFFSTYTLNKNQQNYQITRKLRHQFRKTKNPNCYRIDILQCFIGADGGTANSGGEVVATVVLVLVVMVFVVGYWWWHSVTGSGGDSL